MHADDVDTGTMGRVRYTRLLGQLNGSLALDPETGSVTVATNNHGIDREEAPGQCMLATCQFNAVFRYVRERSIINCWCMSSR